MAQLKDLIVMGAGRVIGKLYASSFSGDGSEITDINANNISSGVLSIDNGGTGSSDAAEARDSLGITPENIGAATSSHNHDDAYALLGHDHDDDYYTKSEVDGKVSNINVQEMTENEYNNLPNKDQDTIYFINDAETTDFEVTNSLRLGNATLQSTGNGVKFIFV